MLVMFCALESKTLVSKKNIEQAKSKYCAQNVISTTRGKYTYHRARKIHHLCAYVFGKQFEQLVVSMYVCYVLRVIK